MEIDLIGRVLKMSLAMALFVFGALSSFNYFFEGLGILIGALWGCLNLFFLKHLIQSWLVLGHRDYLQLYTLIGIKFPILYALGYVVLNIEALPILTLVIGFSLTLLVIFLNGLKSLFEGRLKNSIR